MVDSKRPSTAGRNPETGIRNEERLGLVAVAGNASEAVPSYKRSGTDSTALRLIQPVTVACSQNVIGE